MFSLSLSLLYARNVMGCFVCLSIFECTFTKAKNSFTRPIFCFSSYLISSLVSLTNKSYAHFIRLYSNLAQCNFIANVWSVGKIPIGQFGIQTKNTFLMRMAQNCGLFPLAPSVFVMFVFTFAGAASLLLTLSLMFHSITLLEQICYKLCESTRLESGYNFCFYDKKTLSMSTQPN